MVRHRGDEVTREFDETNLGCRTLHSRTLEPQRNIIPLHGIILSHSVSPHCSCDAWE
jgi:hypothetical protein